MGHPGSVVISHRLVIFPGEESTALLSREVRGAASVLEAKQRKGLESREAISSLTCRFPLRALFLL